MALGETRLPDSDEPQLVVPEVWQDGEPLAPTDPGRRRRPLWVDADEFWAERPRYDD
jgi:hypothetical protein